MSPLFDAVIVMLVLFNPFLMTTYLSELMRELSRGTFATVLLRAFAISGAVFFMFAWLGDRLFSEILHVRFAAFLVFGGVVFFVIALRYMIVGAKMIDALRGPPEHLAGAIAMPFMIGPGTVSASVVIGTRLPMPSACLAITLALALSCLILIITKVLLDWVNAKNERFVERYMEITGRVSAIVIGTIAVDMIMNGIDLWWKGGQTS